MRAYIRDHYKKNTAYYVSKARRRNKAYRQELHKKVFKYFSSHACVDCGESDPMVLEFDHVEGEKRADVSRMISDYCSWALIMEEIAKCEVRCANCHRRKTAREQGWYAYLPPPAIQAW
jgi:hypothetical protein